MLLIFICGWSASDRTRVAGAAASRDVRVLLLLLLLLFHFRPLLVRDYIGRLT